MRNKNNPSIGIYVILQLLVLSLWIADVESQICSSPNIPDFQLAEIDIDAQVQEEIQRYLMVSTTSIIRSYTKINGASEETNYINAKFDPTDNFLVVTPNPEFLNYEENEISTSFYLNVELSCTTSTKLLNLKINIKRANNHPPVFSKPQYDISIPLPLPKGFEITLFQEILARDIDLVNNQVKFTSDITNPFQVGTSTKTGSDGKTFYATLVTTQQILSVSENLIFKITATDSGVPPKQGTAVINITTDVQNTYTERPVFEKPFYTGSLSRTFELKLENVYVTEATYLTEIVFDLTDFDKDYFTYIPSGRGIIISLNQITEDVIDDRENLKFIVTAILLDGRVGTTAVLIELDPKVVPQIPTFEKAIYKGMLKDNTLTHEDIKLTPGTYTDAVTFAIENDLTNLFSIQQTGNNIKISLNREVEMENISFFTFSIVATLEGTTNGTSSVLIEIEKIQLLLPKFQQNLYKGQLSKELVLSEIKLKLTDETYDPNINFDLINFDSNLFQLEKNNFNELTIIKSDQLTAESLKNKVTLEFEVIATNDKIGSSVAVVVIEVPVVTSLQFEKGLYRGQLSHENTLVIETIKLTAETISSDIDYTVSEYDYELFKVVKNDDMSITIELSKTLTEEEITSKQYFQFVITAALNENIFGTTSIIVDIPAIDVIIPTFEKNLYKGTLSIGLQLAITDTIRLIDNSYKDNLSFSLSGSDGELFAVTESNNDVQLKLARELTSVDTKSKNTLQVVITVSEGETVFRSTAVIIDIESEILPQFEKSLYRGVIPDDYQLTVETIKLTSISYSERVEFFLIDSLDSYLFNMIREGNNIRITLKKALTDDEVRFKNNLKFVLMAKSSDILFTTSAVIIDITSKSQEITIPPVFEKTIYRGLLSTDSTLTVEKIVIDIETYSKNIQFGLTQYDEELFTFTVNNNELSIKLKTGLSKEEIKDKSVLQFVVEANLSGTITGKTAVIIVIEDAENPIIVDPPVFEKQLYAGKLSSTYTLSIESIKLMNVDDLTGVTFSVSDYDSELFSVTKPNNIITIELKSLLTSNDVKDKSVLQFRLVASLPETIDGTTAVVIEIDHENEKCPIALSFTKVLYEGNLSKDLTTLSIESVTMTKDTYTTAVAFKLEEDDSSLFTFNPSENGITIVLKKPLAENDVLNKNTLTFSVVAELMGAITTKSGIVINIESEITKGTVLPQFEKDLYRGVLLEGNELTVETIKLNPDSFSETVDVSIVESFDSALFTLESEANIFVVKLKTSLTEDELRKKNNFKIILKAAIAETLFTTSAIIIEITSQTEETAVPPLFEKSIYRGSLSTEYQLTIENILLDIETYSKSINFELTQYDQELFTFTRKNNELSITLKKPLTEQEIKDKSVLQFVVEAVSPGKVTGKTVVIITIEAVENPIVFDPVIFEKQMYTGKLSSTYSLSIEDIKLANPRDTTGVTFLLSEYDFDLFFVTNENSVIKVIPKMPLTSEDVKSKTVLQFILIASLENSIDGTTGVIIEIENEIEECPVVLLFAKVLYEGDLSKDLSAITLESITMTTDTYSESVVFVLEEDDSSLFTINHADNEITIVLKEPLKESDVTNKNTLKFVVVAMLAGTISAKSVVVINVQPEIIKETIIPKFEKDLYRGILSEDYQLTLEAIKLAAASFSETVDVSIVESFDWDLFSVTQEEDNVEITLKKSLTEDEVKSKNNLKLIIKAAISESLFTTSVVIIEVTSQNQVITVPPAFEKSIYRGLLSSDLKLTVENIILDIETYSKSIDFVLTQYDKDLFTFTKNNNELSITLKSPLAQEDIKDKSVLQFVVEAVAPGIVSGKTAVIITIENGESSEAIDPPLFEKQLYTGKLTSTYTLTIEPIKLISTQYIEEIIFSISEYDSELFVSKLQNNEITIELKSPLNNDDVKNKNVLQFLLTASLQNTIDGSTAVIIEIESENDECPALLLFTKVLYEGNLSKDLSTITLESLIMTENTYTPSVEFRFEEDDSSLFTYDPSENGLTILLKAPLTEPDVTKKNSLKFVVVAELAGAISAKSGVIINIQHDIPEEVVLPQFDKDLYKGTLSDDYQLTVETIRITSNSFSESVQVSIVESFDSDLFVITQDKNNIEAKLKTNLTEDKVKNKNNLKLVIKAEITKTVFTTTVIVVDFPSHSKEILLPPAFEKTIYRGLLSNDFTLTVETVVLKIETYSKNIQFKLAQYDQDLFIFTQSNNELVIELKNELFDKDIIDKSVLQFVVEASATGTVTGTTAVIITIESAKNPIELDPPIFEKQLYTGKLSPTYSLEIESIKLVSPQDVREVGLSLAEYDHELFLITNQNNVITIELKSPLTIDDINNKSVLQFIIIASSLDTVDGTTSVIIEIENEDECPIELLFTKVLYEGNLSTDLSTLTLDSVTMTQDTYSTEVKFKLEEDDSSLFTYIPAENGITIALISPLTETDVTNKNTLKFIVVAELAGAIAARSGVVINLQSEKTALPQFDKDLYRGILSKDYQLTVESIKLVSSSVTEKIAVSVIPSFDWNLFNLVQDGINIEIMLLKSLTENDVKNKNNLKLVLKAAVSETLFTKSTVLIEMPSQNQEVVVPPVFEKPIYRGSLSSDFILTVENVILDIETYSTSITFTLAQYDQELFTFSQNKNELLFALKNQLTEEKIKDKSVLQFVVEASVPGKVTGTTAVIITIESVSNPIEVDPPIFEKQLYTGKLSSSYSLSLETIKLVSPQDNTAVVFEIAEYDHELFTISQDYENLNFYIKITLKDPLTDEDVKNKIVLQFTLIASLPNTIEGTTAVIIEIDQQNNECPIALSFTKVLYEGSVAKDYTLSLETITMTEETYASSVEFRLEEDDNLLFHFTPTENGITIDLKSPLVESDIVSKTTLKFIVVARLPGAIDARTGVFIDILINRCDDPNSSTIPEFENKLYSITIAPRDIGLIQTVKAMVPSDTTIKVSYSIQLEDDDLLSKLAINSENGEISTTEVIEVGVHSFLVIATNPNTQSTGSANVKLTVTNIITCPDGTHQVANALETKYLKEEQEHTNIFNTKIDGTDCNFIIHSVEPTTDTQLFKIDPVTNVLQSKSFDRESETYENMLVPQIQIILKLNCNSALINSYNNSISLHRATRATQTFANQRYYVLTDDIPLLADTTILSIIIEDINDNYPIFKEPIGNIVIGYPEPKLAERILPPYLLKVQATDKDEGLNAQIKYSVNSNSNFYINDESGILYPLKNAMSTNNDVTLTVTATDRLGTGLATSIQVTVKQLTDKHFSVLSIQDEVLENLNKILKYIEDKSSLQLNILTAVMVSNEDQTKRVQSKTGLMAVADATQSSILKIIVYAFDADGKPFENEKLEEKLNELDETYIIVVQKLEDIVGNTPPEATPPAPLVKEKSCSNAGYIAAVSILSILFVLAAALSFILWWFWIRPFKVVKRSSINNSASSETNLQSDFNTPSHSKPVNTELFKSKTHDEFRPATYQLTNELPDPTNGTSNFALSQSLAKRLDDGSPQDARKSIKFNELVERIDIPVDA